jgi:hypothetical protein
VPIFKVGPDTISPFEAVRRCLLGIEQAASQNNGFGL